MYELQINKSTYEFNFGMGFMREINKTIAVPVENIKGKTKDIGLQYKVAEMLERTELDKPIEDENTDIDALFDTVLGFLENANATKKTTRELKEEVEKQKKKQEE